jgi:hypothetical protein
MAALISGGGENITHRSVSSSCSLAVFWLLMLLLLLLLLAVFVVVVFRFFLCLTVSGLGVLRSGSARMWMRLLWWTGESDRLV